MADVRPFRGTHYNPGTIGDISSVLCPPYDIITPQMQQELYQRSKYNFVRVECNRELPQDTAEDNRYTRASTALEDWVQQGALVTDGKPVIYLYDQYFTHLVKGYKRRSIIAVVRLEEWATGGIRPHEGTLGAPKADRINLIRACQANTSSILALYEDQGQRISGLLAEQAQKEPFIASVNAEEEMHYVWAMVEPSVINQICHNLANKPLYIADGHHRYESALAYKHEQMSHLPSITGEEPFNFIMMTLVDISDPGLLILPPHRLVRGISKANLDTLLPKLESFFDVEEIPLGTAGVWPKVDNLLDSHSAQDTLALFGLSPKYLHILRLRDASSASQLMPFFHTDLYKRLMVSVVDHVILEKLLEVDAGGKESAILDYSYDIQEAVSRVVNQEYQLAVLLSPVKVNAVKDIADAGDRMPRKSTYFYPKLPSGLIINKW